MRRNRQLIVSSTNGDCFRSCMTSILDIPNDPALPDGGAPAWFLRWWNFLDKFGLSLRYELQACWGTGYWIASVPSLNFDGVTHAIVMRGHEIEFDPSTARAYATGESLLGRNIVKGGWLLEVTDASKFGVLVELQRAATCNRSQ